MRLRIDHLLTDLRANPAAILSAIDADPMLLKREADGLVLANASQELFTPTAEHQLYAKGIVYRRDPYRLVSLPLLKIYNVGEREVTVADLAALATEPGVGTRFLHKIDGSLIQCFRSDGAVRFTTRGSIEGSSRASASAGRNEFDFLGSARRLAERRYPRLLTERWDGRTLVFEIVHPQARVVTDYGDREDLILTAAFDHSRFGYLPYADLSALGEGLGLTVVEAYDLPGTTLAERIDALLARLAGTDREGTVLTFETADAVVYRAKVKSPDYLRLVRAMSECTFANLVAHLDANPHLTDWPTVEAFLMALGTERVPEELLPTYRQYHRTFVRYLQDCERLRAWAEGRRREAQARVAVDPLVDPKGFRREFAELVRPGPHSGLVFLALDGRLDIGRVRGYAPTPEAILEALQRSERP